MLGHKYNKSSSYSSTRRVKHYSYSPLDSIGKGFSSVVYRGLNDNTSNSPFHAWRHAFYHAP